MTTGSMCAKGLSGINALYHPNRNKYPMIRVGERGENKWKRISWQEAIDIIAKKLMETRANMAQKQFSAPRAAAEIRLSVPLLVSAIFSVHRLV